MSKKKADTTILDNAERQPCEVWTRVMGYHRPVQSFEFLKKCKFAERKYFQESKCGLSSCK